MQLRKISVFLLALLLSALTLSAQEIELPKEFNPENTPAAFTYQINRQSLDHKKMRYFIELKANGYMSWRGLYRGVSDFGCSNVGGYIKQKIDGKLHQGLVTEAVKAYNAEIVNKKDPKYQYRTTANNSGLSLFVEYKDKTGYVDLKDERPAEVDKFLEVIHQQTYKILANETGKKQLVKLSLKRNFKDHNIEVSFRNIGNKDFPLIFPKHAHDHFFLELGNGEQEGLSYVRKPANYFPTLRPGEQLTLLLRIPKKVHPSSGIFVYENISPIVGSDGNQQNNRFKLRLCSFDEQGDRVK
jgi:hypothetical protein